MAKILSIGAVLFYVSAPSAYGAAVPGTFLPAYPEVIPGPGFPSLSSLGITSEELYMRKLAAGSADGLTKRVDNFCGGGPGDTANVEDVIACFNYLTALGTTRCFIPADRTQHPMCIAGTAAIRGVDATNHDTSSSCFKVALGVQWVFTYCNNAGQVAGSTAAYGNGDLVVVVGNSRP